MNKIKRIRNGVADFLFIYYTCELNINNIKFNMIKKYLFTSILCSLN